MYEEVKVKRIEKNKPEFGNSEPVLITADNDKKYYLKRRYTKRFNGRDEDAASLQEYISYSIAKKLDVNVPNFAIINLDKNFVLKNKEIIKKEGLEQGKYFGSEFIENSVTAPVKVQEINKSSTVDELWAKKEKYWKEFLANIDPQIFADMIVFNIYISNQDFFKNPTNLISSIDKTGKKTLYAIDFAQSFVNPFLPSTDEQKIDDEGSKAKKDIENFNSSHFKVCKKVALENYVNKKGVPTFPLDLIGSEKDYKNNLVVLYFLSNELSFESNPFKNMVTKIKNLSDKEIEQIVYNAPNEWFVSKYENEDKKVYLTFLKKNRYQVRHVIDYMVGREKMCSAPRCKRIELAMNLLEEPYGSKLKW